MIRLLSVLLVFALPACASQPVNSPISLEERFYQVAFYNEEESAEQRLYRWEGPFAVYLEGAGPDDRRSVRSILNQISDATGQTALISNDRHAPIALGFVSEEEWQKILDLTRQERHARGITAQWTPGCSTHFLPDGIMIAIPESADRALRDACIAQELSHVTGLMNDTDWRSDTVFGGPAGASQLTDVDFQLLTILYDNRLKPGMSWEEAQPIVRQIVSELQTSQSR